MKLVSIDTYPGKEIEVLGMVKGTIVQTKNVASEKPLKLSIAISYMFRPSIYSELIWRFSKEHPS